ncbi:MAG TPA: DMT family transporter [Stellaceae bacterium]|nr:DMT family transporter [Stellaceae bacterium]
MTPLVITLVLCAAILHASWNAVLRGRDDKLWSVTVMSFAATVVAIPVVFVLPLPAAASWPYLALSVGLQVVYSWFLVIAYRLADLGQVYPMIRGSVPLLVTLGAAIFAGEHLSALALSGIVLVSLGIMSLALGKGRAQPKAVAAALANSLVIATYTVTDGIGARLSGNSFTYVSWIFLLYGVVMPAAFMATRGRLIVQWSAPETRTVLAAGVVQLVTYGTVIWALTMAPIGPVSALRETSIVFAALIGRMFLSEPLTARRLSACAVIAVGAACLGYLA